MQQTQQPCWAEGAITVEGQQYVLQDGLAMHEKVAIGDAWIHGNKLSHVSRHYWFWTLSENVRIFSFFKEATGTAFGHYTLDGVNEHFAQDQMSCEELDFWVDPRTGIRVPWRWRFRMTSPQGSVDVVNEAYARFLYTYCMADGNINYYGFIGRANGTVSLADGTVVPIEDLRTYQECGIYPTPLPVN